MAWALVESGNVTTIYTRPKAITLNGIQHPRNIFTVWSAAELKDIGIYSYNEVNASVDSRFYTQGSSTVVVDDVAGTVTKTYTHNEKALAGLKSQKKVLVKATAASLLSGSDWLVIRAAEGGTAVPAAVATYRAAVRTTSGLMETAIDDAADMDAFIALHTDTDDDVGVLNDWPAVPEILS